MQDPLHRPSNAALYLRFPSAVMLIWAVGWGIPSPAKILEEKWIQVVSACFPVILDYESQVALDSTLGPAVPKSRPLDTLNHLFSKKMSRAAPRLILHVMRFWRAEVFMGSAYSLTIRLVPGAVAWWWSVTRLISGIRVLLNATSADGLNLAPIQPRVIIGSVFLSQ